MAVRMREVLARPWVGVRMFHSLFSLVLTKTMFVNKYLRCRRILTDVVSKVCTKCILLANGHEPNLILPRFACPVYFFFLISFSTLTEINILLDENGPWFCILVYNLLAVDPHRQNTTFILDFYWSSKIFNFVISSLWWLPVTCPPRGLWHVRVLSIKPCLHAQLQKHNVGLWKVKTEQSGNSSAGGSIWSP